MNLCSSVIFRHYIHIYVADIQRKFACFIGTSRQEHHLHFHSMPRNYVPIGRFGPNSGYIWRGIYDFMLILDLMKCSEYLYHNEVYNIGAIYSSVYCCAQILKEEQ